MIPPNLYELGGGRSAGSATGEKKGFAAKKSHADARLPQPILRRVLASSKTLGRRVCAHSRVLNLRDLGFKGVRVLEC